MTPDIEAFLDLVSEATLEPELWVPVMERLTDLIGGDAALLSKLNMRDGSGAWRTARLDPECTRQYFDYYTLKNPLSNVPDPTRYLSNWRPQVLTDEDWMPKAELKASEYYNDFMTPQGMHSVVMIRLAAIDEDVFAISVTRPEHRGSFSSEELALCRSLHPHLVRAFAAGQKFTARRHPAEGAAAFLERSGQAIFLVGAGGRLLHLNSAAERLVRRGDGLRTVGDHVVASSKSTDDRLQRLINAATSDDAAPRVGGSMAFATPERELPLYVAVMPMRLEDGSVFGGRSSAMITVTDPEAGLSLSEDHLRSFFGLSRGESRVALALARGQTPKEAADGLCLSFFTVRGHLARIFEKTGTNRQADLIRLLTRLDGLGSQRDV